jgi:hypothetical protein
MKIPVEHGNIATSAVIGGLSIFYILLTRRDFYALLFWLPVFIGLFEYDVPPKTVLKDKVDVTFLSVSAVVAFISLIIDLYLVIPYALFLSTYLLRIPLARRNMRRLGNATGMLAYSAQFSVTLGVDLYLSFLIALTLFIYLLGAEFSIMARLRHDWRMLLYNLIPGLFGFLNVSFYIYSLSLIRIPVSKFTKKINKVGIAETSMLAVVIASLLLSMHYGILL